MKNRKGNVLTASDVIIGTAGMRIMRLLVGNPPQTLTDLVRARRGDAHGRQGATR